MDLWGHGDDLTAVQMTARGVVMFVIVLAQIRIGGVRMFSRKSSFDNVIAIMLGAVAARAVVGASPFGAVVIANSALAVLHRALGWLTVRAGWLETLVKGRRTRLVRDGSIDRDALARTSISEEDLRESLRLETQHEALGRIEAAYVERNGRISFIVRH